MRSVIQIAGESGTGIESSGHIITKALKQLGYYITADREFPSLIKGGNANIQINFSSQPIFAMSNVIDVAVGIDREGILTALERVKPGGFLIHGMDRLNKAVRDFDKQVAEKNIKVIEIPARSIALEHGGSVLMVNVVLLGALWKLLGLNLDVLAAEVSSKFGKKPALLAINLQCLESGYNAVQSDTSFAHISQNAGINSEFNNSHLLIDGNTALSLGAIHAGVRAYFAYPMSPASSILTYLAEVAQQTGMVVKQAEDEITAVQMTIGAMHVGTRAFTGTSGGGFDLMTETISLSGITEIPLVIVIAQRPGPGTGLPTWTGQGDLQMAIHSGHGEFARAVMAVSDPADAFEVIQHAFNYSETFQIPVVVLTEKFVAEKRQTVEKFNQLTIPIQRGLATPAADSLINIHSDESTFIGTKEGEISSPQKSTERFEITENGVSKRWVPGTSSINYFANGDEHHEDGTLDENETAGDMIAKRIRKLDTLLDQYPAPQLFGDEQAKITFVGWGSSKTAVLDAISELKKQGISVNYLHYTYLWPLHTKKLEEIAATSTKLFLIEGNHNGQLGQLIAEKTNIEFTNKLLKWNGRPFYVEEVVEWVIKNIE